jgi:polysaccharide biosynthesis/export protein
MPHALAIFIAACICLSACATKRSDEVAYNPVGFSSPDSLSISTLGEDYRIAPLDKLSISVFQVEQLSGEYQVDLTGRVALPLIGAVSAVDLTTTEFQERLKKLLSVNYLKNPDVTVGVLSATGSSVTIEGAVRRPGVYPNYGKMTLLQAMAIGGGLDNTANAKRVFVFRQVAGQRMIAGFDLTTIRKGQDPDPEIYRGDIVVVEGSRMKENWAQIIQGVQTFGIFRPI